MQRLIPWREGEKRGGKFEKGGGKKINWSMGHFPLFSSVFSLFGALKLSSLTHFPPFFAFDFEFSSIEYNNKQQALKAGGNK